MTATDLCVNKCKQSRSYLNHLVNVANHSCTQLQKLEESYIHEIFSYKV